MEYTVKNDTKISKITLGTAQLGQSYGINNTSGIPDGKEAENILNTALSLGINTFDTSNDYGDSEKKIGEFFGRRKESPVIVTKTGAEGSKAALYDMLAENAEKSLKNLNVSSLPCLMLHHEKFVTEYGRALIDAMNKLKSNGIIRKTGISFSDKADMKKILSDGSFDFVQLPMNIFDCEEILNGTLSKLNKSGMTVFIRSVYLQGLFFKDPDTLPKKLRSAKEHLLKLRALSERYGVSVQAMASGFIYFSEGVDSVLVGCEKASQLEESAKLPLPLPKKLTEEIFEISQKIPSVVKHPWEWNN